MSSDIFPWMSEYEIQQLPNFSEILPDMQAIGRFALANGIRISMHPGQFDVLPSPTQSVVTKTVKDLDQHCEIMDLMGLPTHVGFPINIHVGGAYGNKQEAMKRWVDNFQLLDESTKKRLTVENDDKPNMFTVKDLLYIHEHTKIPIVFDYHHHNCHNDGMTTEDALKLAVATWPSGITPTVHVSEPRDDKNFRAHHDYVRNEVNTYGYDLDLMFESKAKEISVLEYRKKFGLLLV
jgi:UV DNA damage endonuclease